jgi:FkbM family methyltransferase
MKKYPLDRIEIDFLGRKHPFFGDIQDDYFRNLQVNAAQNDLLFKVASEINLSGNCFLDIGANIGVTAQMIRMIHPDANIICLEPSPKAYFYIQKNAGEGMLLFNVAAGNKTGEVDFFEADYLAGSSINLMTDGVSCSRKTIKVPLTTIDGLVANHSIEQIKLIKVDVEGFELDVLQGARKTINRFDPVFVCEFNSYALAANGKMSPFAFLEFIVSMFGKFYAHRDGASICISSDRDMRDYFYQNMVTYGCVEDIYFGGGFELS